jgi:predicted anti-sigma-YlaC factor YlaD
LADLVAAAVVFIIIIWRPCFVCGVCVVFVGFEASIAVTQQPDGVMGSDT